MAREQPVEEPEVPKPSRKPARYLMLILAIMILEASGGYLVLDHAVPKPERVAEPKPSQAKPKFVKPIYFLGLKNMVINPTSAQGQHLVQISFALEVDTDAALQELTLKQQETWDLVMRTLEGYSLETLRDPAKKVVKEAVERRVNAELKNGEVTAVYVTDFVVQ